MERSIEQAQCARNRQALGLMPVTVALLVAAMLAVVWSGCEPRKAA